MDDDEEVTEDVVKDIETECNLESMQWKRMLRLGKRWRQEDRETSAHRVKFTKSRMARTMSPRLWYAWTTTLWSIKARRARLKRFRLA